MATTLETLNTCPAGEFVALAGPVFEHSPWIAEQAAGSRPFADREALLAAMVEVVATADREQQLALIRAHPDLVGRVGRAVLTAESTREQAAAGLMQLTSEEAALFQRYNGEYREKFGFPFVICARLNKKDAILAAFPKRLENSADVEVATALGEIYKIAALRIADLLSDSP